MKRKSRWKNRWGYWVKVEYPLKQGLKQVCTKIPSISDSTVKVEYPLKQGLKPIW